MTENKIAIQHQASNNKTYQNQTLPSESKLKDPHVSNSLQERKMNLAASWYIAMPSKALKKDLKEIELFGKSLMAWRDSQGTPIIMERYCAHLGANLAVGKIVDGCVQCPFHHWQYDRTGQCVHIPDVNHIPSHARQTTYNIIEKYGYIWIWYGSKQPLFPLPEFVPAGDWRQDYMPYSFEFEVSTSAMRVAENTYDHQHVVTVHELEVSDFPQLILHSNQHHEHYIEPKSKEETCFHVTMKFPLQNHVGPLGKLVKGLGLDAETLVLKVKGWPSGHRVTGFIKNQERFQTFGGITPITGQKTIKHSLVMVKKTGNLFLDMLYYILFGWQSKNSFRQDIPIWNTMGEIEHSAYVKHDIGVLNFRRFYQSWVARIEENA